MKRLFFSILSSAAVMMTTVGFLACQGNQFKIEGHIADAPDSVLYLENMALDGPQKVDSIPLTADGAFAFSQAAPADGSPAAQASLTPAQTDVMPHIRRVALRAAQLFPAEPSFLSSLAYTYIAEADYPTALRHLNRAEQLAPNDPAILQQLVDIHTRMKNKKQANIYRTRLAEQTRP